MKRYLSLFLVLAVILTALACCPASAQGSDSAEEILVPRIDIVTTDGVGLQLKKADGYVAATVTVTDTDGSQVGGGAQVKIRGNSTSGLNKKSYTVKFDSKCNVLGMGKAKKWAFVANAFDPTLLRNYIGISTAAQLGVDYTSERRFVELWMDGSFRGCYLLLEPTEEGKTRVDIDIDSNDGMNDFLIEREYNHVDEGAVYFTANSIRFLCKDPDEPNEEQLAYIKNTMNEIFTILRTGTRSQIEEKVDVTSFAKYYLLNEFVKTVDVDYSSIFFFYKDGKLYAGPAWDYDLSMGNEDANASANYAAANSPEDLYCNNRHLFNLLCRYPWFFDEVRRVYLANSDYLDSIGAEGGLIDSLYDEYQTVINRNFSQAGWRVTSYYANFNKKPSSTYQENLDYLSEWCSARAAWLKGYFTEDVEEYMLGDSNRNGRIDIMDATAIQRALVLLPAANYDEAAADSDGNATVTILDATIIQRYLVQLTVSAPIGECQYKKL